jgi:hypothetical protein
MVSLSTRAVRGFVLVVCALGIAGMIAASVGDEQGVALTAGLVSAAAVLCLIVATAVTGRGADPDAVAAGIEARIAALVAAGGSEAELRALVAEAVKLGRQRQGG